MMLFQNLSLIIFFKFTKYKVLSNDSSKSPPINSNAYSIAINAHCFLSFIVDAIQKRSASSLVNIKSNFFSNYNDSFYYCLML